MHTSDLAGQRRYAPSSAPRPLIGDRLERAASAVLAAAPLLPCSTTELSEAAAACIAAQPSSEGAGPLREAARGCADGRAGAALRAVEDGYRRRLTDRTGTVDDAWLGALSQVEPTIAWSRLLEAVIIAESHRHIGLVWRQANRLARSFPARSPEDLVSFGWLGLRRALRNYDPQVAAFSTYAVTLIDGDIREGVRREHPLPKRLTTYVRKVARAEGDLTAELGRAPRLAELAERLDQRIEDLAILARLHTPASIDELTDADEDRRDAPAWLTDTADVEDAAVRQACTEAVHAALGRLEGDEQTAAELLLLQGKSSTEAARLSGVPARRLLAAKRRAAEQLTVLLSDWETAASR